MGRKNILVASGVGKKACMLNGFRLGKIFGVDIYISYSWFFIFLLVTFMLTYGIFPQNYPTHSFLINLMLGLFTAALFFGSLLFHELSHAFIANRNKIPITRITLFIFGGMAQMSEEPHKPSSEFKMAIAGPLSSLLLAAVFFGIFTLLVVGGFSSPYFAPFEWLWQINVLLAIFNLVPGYPLDGGRVFRSILWMITKNQQKATNIAAKVGQGFAYFLMGIGILLVINDNFGGLWFILIGWFLNRSASASYQQLLLQNALSGLKVEDLMSTEVKTVTPDIDLETLVNDYFLNYKFGRFPVIDGNDLLGIVTLHDIKDVQRDMWPKTTTGEVVEKLIEPMYVKADDEAVHALTKMVQEDIGHLLVIDDTNHLEGIITRADIIRLMKIRSELMS